MCKISPITKGNIEKDEIATAYWNSEQHRVGPHCKLVLATMENSLAMSKTAG